MCRWVKGPFGFLMWINSVLYKLSAMPIDVWLGCGKKINNSDSLTRNNVKPVKESVP